MAEISAARFSTSAAHTQEVSCPSVYAPYILSLRSHLPLFLCWEPYKKRVKNKKAATLLSALRMRLHQNAHHSRIFASQGRNVLPRHFLSILGKSSYSSTPSNLSWFHTHHKNKVSRIFDRRIKFWIGWKSDDKIASARPLEPAHQKDGFLMLRWFFLLLCSWFYWRQENR